MQAPRPADPCPSSQQYYDEFVDHQVEVGINERHRSIMRYLERFGLKGSHRVLEVGCGVGTLTQLLAEALRSDGELLATDLSPKSIEVAERELGGHPSVSFLTGDIVEMPIPGQFDVVVLPDVIEHIPLEQHPVLFERIASWIRPGGFALLHYPNPNYLQWCIETKPDAQQVIDQPVYTDELTANAYPHGLYLDYLETYSIWVEEGDYQVAVMRRKEDASVFTDIPWRPPFRQKVREALQLRARRLLRRIRREPA